MIHSLSLWERAGVRGRKRKTLDSCFRRNDGFGVSMPIFIPMTDL